MSNSIDVRRFGQARSITIKKTILTFIAKIVIVGQLLVFLNQMDSKKILITGGLGYIGSHTALVFAQAGYEPILIDNLSNTHKTEVMEGIKKVL